MLLDRPVTSPRIVGRERELDALAALLDQRMGMVLVSGQAGVGKSRLVREALTNAAARGFRVLQGACFDRDQALPYAPFLDLWRAFATSQPDEARRLLQSRAPSFLRLVPELSVLPITAEATL